MCNISFAHINYALPPLDVSIFLKSDSHWRSRESMCIQSTSTTKRKCVQLHIHFDIYSYSSRKYADKSLKEILRILFCLYIASKSNSFYLKVILNVYFIIPIFILMKDFNRHPYIHLMKF